MLPRNEWLPQAQRLAVGMRMRVVHNRERTAAMTISNERDRWWCYCQRCKQGGVVMKDHVLLTAPAQAVTVQELTLPTDVQPVMGSEYEEAVGRFLASKNMMFPYLPTVYYSLSARRMLLNDAGHWHGRDLTGRSERKWLNYHGQKFVGMPAPRTVITEDLFSMYKLRFALRGSDVQVCCSLGAGIHDAAVLALRNCTDVVCAYDADKAGDAGAAAVRTRLRPFGMRVRRARPPDGQDPKDMDCEDLRDMIYGALDG